MEVLEHIGKRTRKTDFLHLHEIAPDFVRITDTIARRVFKYSGKGDRKKAEEAAIAAMEEVLQTLPYKVHVIVGEGESESRHPHEESKKFGMPIKENIILEAVVDPLECAGNFVKGLPDSLSAILISTEGSIRKVPRTYMKQLLLPREVREFGKLLIYGNSLNSYTSEEREFLFKYFKVDPATPGKVLVDKSLLDADIKDILRLVSIATGRDIEDITVVIQDRPRHEELIQKVRSLGAGISLIDSGSISASAEIILRKENRLNLLMGTYGAPEGIIQAFMAKSTNAIFLGKIQPHNEKTEQEAEEMGILNEILTEEEWVQDEAILIMSGIHSSPWLPGIRRRPKKYYSVGEKNYRLLVSSIVWTINNVVLYELEDGDMRKREIIYQ